MYSQTEGTDQVIMLHQSLALVSLVAKDSTGLSLKSSWVVTRCLVATCWCRVAVATNTRVDISPKRETRWGQLYAKLTGGHAVHNDRLMSTI